MVFYPIKTVLCVALYLSHGSAQSENKGPLIADRADFPFTASLHIPNGTVCGGVIYNNRTIITVAQCVENIIGGNNTQNVIVLTGHSELDKATNYTVQFNASSIMIHENYERGTFRDDLAVVKINGSFDWNAHVQPLEIAPLNLNTSTRDCNITGWNTAQGDPAKYSMLQLRKVQLTSTRLCTAFLSEKNLDTNANFCTDLGDDTLMEFSGDKGGPLICQGYLYGVQSVNFDSGLHTYTDVKSHREWLERNHSKSLIYSPLSILLLFCNTFTTYLFIVSIFNWN